MKPLQGIRVLDFSTLLPGPLATLMLCEAGAEVIKIERPPIGDEIRTYVPKAGRYSVVFAVLNRGKRSVCIDLKQTGSIGRLRPLIESADVLVEQFRPGVMDRLGLGYEALRAINPRLVYCSVSGYGMSGPKADKAAHDLNYVAESGLLSLVARPGEAPALPPTLIADIGGGTYPAVVNILLALQQRHATGEGCHLDVSMNDNILPFMYWAIGQGLGLGQWPRPGRELTTGGSPRYNIYRCADGRWMAAAPIEERFWVRFCEGIGLAPAERDDSVDPEATRKAVAALVATQPAEHWSRVFAEVDACVSIVASVEEAFADAHYRARGVFDHRVTAFDQDLPACPMPIDRAFRGAAAAASGPELGEANGLLG